MKLILLPGLDGTGKLFYPLIQVFPASIEYQIISYPQQEISYVDIILYVYNQLPKNEDYIIVAESFSGNIAYELALKKPNNLQTIIFIATFLNNPKPLFLNPITLLPLQYILQIPIPIVILKYLFFTKEIDNDILLLAKNVIKTIPTNILLNRLKILSQNKRCLKSVDLNIYNIIGTQDKLVPFTTLKTFSKVFKSVTLYEINSGHLVLQSNPNECCDLIMDIINHTKTLKC